MVYNLLTVDRGIIPVRYSNENPKQLYINGTSIPYKRFCKLVIKLALGAEAVNIRLGRRKTLEVFLDRYEKNIHLGTYVIPINSFLSLANYSFSGGETPWNKENDSNSKSDYKNNKRPFHINKLFRRVKRKMHIIDAESLQFKFMREKDFTNLFYYLSR